MFTSNVPLLMRSGLTLGITRRAFNLITAYLHLPFQTGRETDEQLVRSGEKI